MIVYVFSGSAAEASGAAEGTGKAAAKRVFYPCVGHKGSATVDWFLPRLNFILKWLTKNLLPQHGSFLLALLRWRGIFLLQISPQTRVVHKKSAALERPCFLQTSVSGGSQQVCCIGMCPSSSERRPEAAHLINGLLPWSGRCLLQLHLRLAHKMVP